MKSVSGEVSELADEHDLGSCAARRAGSTPAFPNVNGERQFIDAPRFGLRLGLVTEPGPLLHS